MNKVEMKRKTVRNDLKQLSGRSRHIIAACLAVFEKCNERRILASWAYGSVLGSRHRQDSDLDIAVLDLSDDALPWVIQSKLMDALERASGWPVDLRMLREYGNSFQLHVLDFGQQIWNVDPIFVRRYFDRLRSAHERERQERTGLWKKTLRQLAQEDGR